MVAAGLGAGAQTDRRGLSVLDGGKVEDERRVLDATRVAFELGGDVNAVNQAGDTALHGAAALGYNTVVQFLADHGAQLNVKNKRGQTALAAIAGQKGRRRHGRRPRQPVPAPEHGGSAAQARRGRVKSFPQRLVERNQEILDTEMQPRRREEDQYEEEIGMFFFVLSCLRGCT